MNNSDNIKNILQKAFQDFEAEPGEKVWKGVEKELHPGKRKRGIIFYWAAAAALLLVILSVPVYLVIKNQTGEKIISQQSGAGEKKRVMEKTYVREAENGKTGKSEQSGDPAELSAIRPDTVRTAERDGTTERRQKDKTNLTPSIKENNEAPEQVSEGQVVINNEEKTTFGQTERPIVQMEVKNEKIPEIAPYLNTSLEEQKIRKGNEIPFESNPLPPEPLLAYNKWVVSAGVVSAPDYSTAGGESRTYTIPNSGTTTLVYSADTTGYNANRTITWSQNTMQTDIGYLPVSTASIEYDTAWQTVPRVDTIRTPDKQITETPGDIKYGIPVITGITLYYCINDRISVGSGVSWSMFSAQQDFTYSDGSGKRVESKLQYGGIPVNVTYYFIKGRHLVWYASAGAAWEWNFSNRIIAASTDNAGISATVITTNKPSGYQIYLTGGTGIEYYLTKQLTFYFQPSVTAFVIKDKNPYHPSNNKKYIPAVQTGIRFRF